MSQGRFLSALCGPIGGKLLLVMLPLALLPALIVAILLVQQFSAQPAERALERAEIESDAAARLIGARLAAAEATAWTFARSAASTERVRWRDQVVSSEPFARVAVTNTASVEDDGRPLLQIDTRNLDDSAIVTLGTGERSARIYLVREIAGFAARTQWAYFELDDQWLWQDLRQSRENIAVIDANGQWLYGAGRLPDGLRASLGAALAAGATHGAAGDAVTQRPPEHHRITWQVDGIEWQGAYRTVPRPARLASNAAWSVIAMHSSRSDWYAPLMPLLDHWPIGLLLVLVPCLLAAWIADRYTLPLAELSATALRIGQRHFAPSTLPMPQELHALAQNLNLTGAQVAEDLHGLTALEEVDRLLLSNHELEPCLEVILNWVQKVMHCRCVGLTLLDTDSPQFARVLIATEQGASLPVTRVALDREMLELLAGAPDGITIARCEQQRHSFLLPLVECGAQFFWVWPVKTGERLAAILAVAFAEPPSAEPRVAHRGGEFAARLAIALSKSARDEHLYRQAHYDPLTGLPNRVLFNQLLDAELGRAATANSTGALLYIDLDHFKKVNDTVGHSAVDHLLGIVALRLRAAVKESDTVSRLAGDEFTIILPQVESPQAAAAVAERVIESLSQPIHVAGRDHLVQASIGIALFPDDGRTVEDLLRNADGAMYRAKDMGRSRAVFFDRKLAISQADPTNSGLFRALRRREFSLYYQPQFRLSDGFLIGVEALLRWHTPRDGLREPREFIPAAESSGLIVDIGGWVLEAACTQLALWREQGIAPPRLAINVSAQQLKHGDFARTVRRALDKLALTPDLLEIELTESVLADQSAGAVLTQLAELGVRLALDDFGTGYSSLNYLRQHPIDAVKIDRSFIEEVPVNAACATLAETIITMAHALGKEVVAEGIETDEQLQFLRERGCDIAQGYFLAPPMPAPQLADLLQTHGRSADRRGLRVAS
ncbi:MAG: EAL domain-containing protein [Steroidobacteraceae bacterium]|nr:EAL domain-containing protein [Steroidobacteraceae bacterium]MDW8259658.1 EAL domain-containing protein [Gammaproteobacteria bacterium]